MSADISRLLILDQDGTLYSRRHPLYLEMQRQTRAWVGTALNIDSAACEKLFTSLQEQQPIPYLGFLSVGLPVADYLRVFDKIAVHAFLREDPDLQEQLNHFSGCVAVATYSSPRFSDSVLEALGIRQRIDVRLTMDAFAPGYSKLDAYRSILQRTGCKPADAIAVGDNAPLDLTPARMLGMRTQLVTPDNNWGKTRILNA